MVLDPGPEEHPEHVEAILRAAGPNIALILVSHTHHDHVGAVPALQAGNRGAHGRLPRQRPRQLRGRHQAGRRRRDRRHDGDPHAGPRVGPSLFRAAGAGRHSGAVQRRSCDVVVHQRRQPAGRRHAGLFRQPAAAAGADRRCVPARPRSAVARAAQPGARNADAPHDARAGDRAELDEGQPARTR